MDGDGDGSGDSGSGVGFGCDLVERNGLRREMM